MKIFNMVLFLIAASAISGCHPLFCVWDSGYVSVKKQSVQSVIGKYVLSTQSKKIMKYEGEYKNIPDSHVEIKVDGTYSLTNAPDWLANDFGNSNGNYLSKYGKWNLDCDNKDCILELEGLQVGELLFEKDGKLYILLSVGDPDSCIGMVYERL